MALLAPANHPINESLLRFATVGLGFDRINVNEHGHILKLLSDIEFSAPQKIYMLLLPRASYKTTIASVSLPMFLLSRDPNLRILIDSETYSLSMSILSEIKQHYESPVSSLIHTPFSLAHTPRSQIDRWAEDSIILPSRTIPKKEGSIDAAGVDGVKAGKHYDIIIADDLHSQNNTRTSYQIEQVIEHYRLLLSILEPNGILIVIGTRWAEEDAYTTIAKDATKSLFIPAASTSPMNFASELRETSLPRLVYDELTDSAEDSNIFYVNFPKTLPVEHLDRIEQRQGPYIYSAQYILKPRASREKRFREEWFRFYKTPPKHGRVMGFIDPAFTTQEYSDPSGIVIVKVDENRNVYVLHDEAAKLEPYSLIDKIFKLTDSFDVFEWFVEEVAAQKVLRFFMDYIAAKENRHVTFTPVKHGGRKKETRIQALQPYFAAGKFYFRENTESELLTQLRKFPILKNDDVIDALGYLPQVLYDGEGPPLEPEVPKKGILMNDLIKDLHKPQVKGIRSWDDNRTVTRYYVA